MKTKKEKIKVSKIKKAARRFHEELKKNIINAISAAFGFLIALSWRDTIKEIINQITVPLTIMQGILWHVAFSLIVTVICVVGIILISKLNKK